MKPKVMEARRVSVSFDGAPVLKNVDLEVLEGECFVLIGPSGQGKTTMLKTLAGLVEPQEGEVFIQSKNWKSIDGSERLELLKKVGMLFQKNALFDSFTCGENIAFPLRETTGSSSAEIEQKVDAYLEAVGIPHAKNLYPDEISGGMQKRLGIARALALRPSIIFYDDPTAGLDPITSRKIIELILRLRSEDRSTVVAVTNDMNRAFQMGDRIGMIVDGELIITGSPDETRRHEDPRVHQFIRGQLEGPLTALA
jgi:phospholipid/cholesterol/gamma-HCH transport system ATP-binding protein